MNGMVLKRRRHDPAAPRSCPTDRLLAMTFTSEYPSHSLYVLIGHSGMTLRPGQTAQSGQPRQSPVARKAGRADHSVQPRQPVLARIAPEARHDGADAAGHAARSGRTHHTVQAGQAGQPVQPGGSLIAGVAPHALQRTIHEAWHASQSHRPVVAVVARRSLVAGQAGPSGQSIVASVALVASLGARFQLARLSLHAGVAALSLRSVVSLDADHADKSGQSLFALPARVASLALQSRRTLVSFRTLGGGVTAYRSARVTALAAQPLQTGHPVRSGTAIFAGHAGRTVVTDHAVVALVALRSLTADAGQSGRSILAAHSVQSHFALVALFALGADVAGHSRQAFRARDAVRHLRHGARFAPISLVTALSFGTSVV
uniref:Uncharacterized protein n=1 Tax=Anopheles coluzzii TaxID=1518534 RepID=A0A8W7P776_ANOCL